MKKSFIYTLLLCVLFGVSACENYPFYVPDNFPIDDIYSYLPYSAKDTLLYVNHNNDTMRLLVEQHDSVYVRGQRNNDYSTKELASVVSKLTNPSWYITVSCACYDRTTFEAKIMHHTQGYNPKILHEYLYQQDEMSDMIFQQFVPKLSLSDGKAIILRDKGLTYFVDPQSVAWEYVGKRKKKDTTKPK